MMKGCVALDHSKSLKDISSPKSTPLLGRNVAQPKFQFFLHISTQEHTYLVLLQMIKMSC